MRAYTGIRRTRRNLSTAATVVALVTGARAASAQSAIVIDWSTRTLVASPPEIGRTASAIVTIRNVNDVLYDYTVDISEVRRPIDDFAALAALRTTVTATPPGIEDPCRTMEARAHLAGATKAIAASPELTPVPNAEGKYQSVAVGTTVATWQRAVAPEVKMVRTLETEIRQKLGSCLNRDAANDFLTNEFPAFNAAITALERRIASPHVIQVPITLRPDTDYTLVVTERIGGATTIDGGKSFTFSPASAVLTLSAGFGVTWLEGRAYSARTVPGVNPGDPVKTVLAVDGIGQRPVMVALLNYQFPFSRSDDYGLSVSSGPVIAFNTGTSNSSSLGFFAGISGHLFRRFYVTPGLHIGEFADTPLGFSGPGAPIPEKFGALAPQKRWTTKFAIMMTYRTVDFSKVTPKPKTADTTDKQP